MQTTYTKQFSCMFYNTMTQATFQPKQFTLEVTVPSGANFSVVRSEVDFYVERFNQSYVVGVDNPDLIRLLEPKTGATVHGFLENLKKKVVGKDLLLLGQSIPYDTVNGDRVLVLGPAVTMTMEGLAQFFLESIRAQRVRLSDGAFTVETDNTEPQTTLL